MKSLVLLATIAVAFQVANAASAQSVWDGPYAGISASTFSGEDTYKNTDGDEDFELEGQMFGAFGGYSISMNQFVVGGELSFMLGAIDEEGFEDEYQYTSIIDLKGRVGFNGGEILPYVVLGASIATLDVDEEARPDRNFEQTETGVLFGVGAEYAISEQFILGAEYISRNFEFEFPSDIPLVDMDATVNSVALRGAYRF